MVWSTQGTDPEPLLDQLDPPQISFAVKQCCLKNLLEAVSSTIELESYLMREQSVHTVNEAASEPATALEFQVAPVQSVTIATATGSYQKLETSGP